MGRASLRSIVEHNPFYLLSALFMLIGCYTLSRSLDIGPGHTGRLLVLIATLNVYEALVIGLALLLILRRGLRRDGRMLLLVEVVFLLDGTFLDGEAFAADLATGALVSAAIFGLALVKVLVVVRRLQWRRDHAFSLLVFELALLLGLPGLFAYSASRAVVFGVSASAVYSMWWAVAVLIVGQALIARTATTPEAPRGEIETVVRRALGWGPHVSLALHLIGLAWVHRAPFDLAYFGPPLVALAAARTLVELPWPALHWRLPVVAIVLSLFAGPGLVPESLLGVRLTPAHVVLVAAGLTYLLGWLLHGERPFAIGAALCLGGPAVWMGVPLAWRAGEAAVAGLGGWIPRTAANWGIIAVVIAFALLGLGAFVSLKQPASGTGAPDDSDAPR